MNALNLVKNDGGNIRLKPCAFCGAPAETFHAFPWVGHGWHVECDHDETCILRVPHGMIGCEETEADMAAAWNRRHDETPSEFERLCGKENSHV